MSQITTYDEVSNLIIALREALDTNISIMLSPEQVSVTLRYIKELEDGIDDRS